LFAPATNRALRLPPRPEAGVPQGAGHNRAFGGTTGFAETGFPDAGISNPLAIKGDGGRVMERTRKDIGLRLGFLGVLLILAVPRVSWGAEFSASMLVKDDAKIMPGKIEFNNGKMRQEFTDERGQTITIVRPDLKVVWVILPRQGTYLEMPLTTKLPGQFLQIPPQAVGKRLVGQEKLNGYDTEKYEVSVPVGGRQERQTYWVAAKLGLPIKMECRERRFSLEYQSIKEEKVPDRRFNLPPGVKKLDSIGGFADKVEE
jgi:hypothetical protein